MRERARAVMSQMVLKKAGARRGACDSHGGGGGGGKKLGYVWRPRVSTLILLIVRGITCR